MGEEGPNLDRRAFLRRTGEVVAGAALVAAGVTGAEAQEVKSETQESKIPSAEEIAVMTKKAIHEAMQKGQSTMQEGFVTELGKRICGGQNPAAGVETLDTDTMHRATPLQRDVYGAYESFKHEIESYLDATQSAMVLEAANKKLLHEINDPKKREERARLRVPSIELASSGGLTIEDKTISNAERMRKAALTLEAANKALLQ